MGKADVLDRVDADLACGHTAPAIQRLSSLVAAHPTDLDLRHRLAATHRMVGNVIEAGRWGYLTADADPAETRAFERTYPSPAHRLRALRWPARGYAATEFARTRLAELGADQVPVPAAPRPPRWRPDRRLIAMLVAGSPFAVLGAVTVVEWIIR
jgi:uncharacterized protein DUF6584